MKVIYAPDTDTLSLIFSDHQQDRTFSQAEFSSAVKSPFPSGENLR
jgi:hypothetical protein